MKRCTLRGAYVKAKVLSYTHTHDTAGITRIVTGQIRKHKQKLHNIILSTTNITWTGRKPNFK